MFNLSLKTLTHYVFLNFIPLTRLIPLKRQYIVLLGMIFDTDGI